jgi:putative pyruvate formate lyase activating enzyme
LIRNIFIDFSEDVKKSGRKGDVGSEKGEGGRKKPYSDFLSLFICYDPGKKMGRKKKVGSAKTEGGRRKKVGSAKGERERIRIFLPASEFVLPTFFKNLYESCRLCPRNCGVNRLKGESGFCREGADLRVSYVGPHFGEEPPLTGSCGSGTVFLTGCSLRCSFCQNFQISRESVGTAMKMEDLLSRIILMIREKRVHNINMVTPDHFFPHVFRVTELLRESGSDLPIVYNLSGYQSKAMLEMAEPLVEIYLPDFKYSDRDLSSGLSGCRDYPDVALQAVAEMLKQKGFLDSCESEDPLARRGVLVRHMILPGRIQNSLDVLTTLFLEFGSGLPLSLMSQYTPVTPQKLGDLNRAVHADEFDRVYRHALELGFERLYVQFPEERSPNSPCRTPFLPDFRKEDPFEPR